MLLLLLLLLLFLFSYPGNERNYKFNLEVLDLLESVSKALLFQDSAKASLLLNESIKLIKERNRKIRIADSSEGGWFTVKHYESNAVALDLEDDKGSALLKGKL